MSLEVSSLLYSFLGQSQEVEMLVDPLGGPSASDFHLMSDGFYKFQSNRKAPTRHGKFIFPPTGKQDNIYVFFRLLLKTSLNWTRG